MVKKVKHRLRHHHVVIAASLLLVMCLVVVVGLQALLGTHALSYVTETADPANDFLDTIGVNTHMGYDDYVNNNQKTLQSLQALGVRWVRDDTSPDNDKAVAGVKYLAQNGIGLDIAKAHHSGSGANAAYNTKLLNMINTNFKASTFAVEGINEPDNTSFLPRPTVTSITTGKQVADKFNTDWVKTICSDQADLYSKFKNTGIDVMTPPLMGINNVGLTFNGKSGDGYSVQLQKNCPNIGANADIGNIHYYPGGQTPESSLDKHLGYIKTYEGTGSKPLAVTETAYDTALQNTQGNGPIDEAGQAVYLPRTYLSFFESGVSYTAPYELADSGNDQTDQEKTFGLFHHNWTPKPAATAIGNLTTILADTTSKRPGSLQYALSDTGDDVHHVLLQKSDGSFYMALWRDASVWKVGDATSDPKWAGQKDVDPGTADETVSFPGNVNITTYVPNTKATPTVDQVTAASKTIALGAKVVILKITSTNVAPATAPDLVVTSVTPVTGTTGNALTFSAVIKNQGSGATPAGTVIGANFKIDGKQVAWSDTNTSSLAPGATVTLTANNGPGGKASWTATAGSHSILAEVDDVDRIPESNDNNNTFSSALTISDPVAPVKLGDANNDGHVNTLDLSLLLSHDNQNYPPADFNHDGTIGAADLAILLSRWTW